MGVVVVGDALIDVIEELGAGAGPDAGPGSGGVGISRHVGGAALNVAVGLTVLGVPTRLVAMVGDDADGEWIGRYLAEHGVELIGCPAPNGSAVAVSRRVDGEPTYEFNLAARERRIVIGDSERAALDAADHIVISCFPLDDVEQTSAVLGAIGDRRRRLIVDPNPRSGMMNDLGQFREAVAEVARSCRLIKIGDDDAAMLYGMPVEAAAQMLLGIGASAVLTTSGAGGAALYTGDGEVVTAPVTDLPGPIVDTMGAGDATVAAVVRAVHDADAMRVPVQWDAVLRDAMGAAAATCRAPGALLRTP